MAVASPDGAAARRLSWHDLRQALFDGAHDGTRTLVERLPDRLHARAWRVPPSRSQDATSRAVGFRSSGTTGPPRRVVRTGEQLRQEADRLSSEALAHAIDEIVGFAPVTHLFGFACGLCLAERRDVPFVHAPLLGGLDAGTAPRAGARSAVLSLPGTWGQLLRSRRFLSRPERFVVLHSAGPIPARHAHAISGLIRRGLALVEIFGSTETGAIALRRDDPTGARSWSPLLDVFVRVAPEDVGGSGRLQVTGPRCSPIGARVETGDIVEPTSNGGFRFVGRASRIIKVNGRAVCLDVVERALARRLPNLETAAAATSDPVRGEAFSLTVVARGVPAAERGSLEAAVGCALREELGPGIYPREIVPVPQIVRTVTGKART